MNSSRSSYVIGLVVFVVAIGLGVLLLSRTGGGPPTAAPSQTPSPQPSVTEGAPTTAPAPSVVSADEGSTVVRFDVKGDCENCQVVATASNAADGQSSWSASVDRGTASVEVPTPNTLGMSFQVKNPGTKEDTQNLPGTLVFLTPKGAEAGTAVTGKDLRAAGAGGYCWAGTTLDTAIITLRAKNKNGELFRIWANPALPTLSGSLPLKAAAKKPATCPQA